MTDPAIDQPTPPPIGAAVLATLRAAGVVVKIGRKGPTLGPPELVTPDHRQVARDHRVEVLEEPRAEANAAIPGMELEAFAESAEVLVVQTPTGPVTFAGDRAQIDPVEDDPDRPVFRGAELLVLTATPAIASTVSLIKRTFADLGTPTVLERTVDGVPAPEYEQARRAGLLAL